MTQLKTSSATEHLKKYTTYICMTEQTDTTSGKDIIDITNADKDGDQMMPSINEVFKSYGNEDFQASINI